MHPSDGWTLGSERADGTRVQAAPSDGARWAAAVGSEAARLSGYLGLLARAAGFARIAGAGHAAVVDAGHASSAWRVALPAAAAAVGHEAGIRLAVVSGAERPDPDVPLALVAVDLDQADAVAQGAAWLAAAPTELLPRVVVCVRSARRTGPRGRASSRRPASWSGPAGGAAALPSRIAAPPAVDVDVAAYALVAPAARRLQASSVRPWPVGPSAPDALEWVWTCHVTDHPRAGLLHLPLTTARTA